MLKAFRRESENKRVFEGASPLKYLRRDIFAGHGAGAASASAVAVVVFVLALTLRHIIMRDHPTGSNNSGVEEQIRQCPHVGSPHAIYYTRPSFRRVL